MSAYARKGSNMIAKNVSEFDLRTAAEECGLTVDPEYKGRGAYRFRLHLSAAIPPKGQAKPYQRMTGEGRKVAAVCWHGHRDFFTALFRRCPGAIIKTAMATYSGAEHFAATFEATGDINIGSQYRPLLAREACFCGEALP